MEELESASLETDATDDPSEAVPILQDEDSQTGDPLTHAEQEQESTEPDNKMPETPSEHSSSSPRGRVKDKDLSLEIGRSPGKGTSDRPYQPPNEGSRKNVTKPKKKPPLFRTKVSDENLLESSIPRLTRQASQDEPLPIDRSLGRRKSNGSRNKFLLRSQQVSDDSSPPPTPDIAIHIQQSEPPAVCRFPHQYSGDGPSLTPFLKQTSYEARSEPALSREPSQEKEFTDSKGVNLQQFIIDTLRKPQDRTMLLQLEKELVDLVNSSASEKKFGPMSSYHRMIVHRVAAYFGLDHNVDQSGKTVIVEKTINTRIPEKKFKEHIQDDKLEGPARTILKRDTASYEEREYYDQPDRSDIYSKDDKKSKSFEERQEQYDKARARIFKQGSSGQEALTVDSPTRPRQILQLNSRQSSGASDDSSYYWKQDRPWSSVDSSGSDRPNVPVITKASSFGGSTISGHILMRGDSGGSSQSTGSPSSGSIASSSSGSKLQENQDGSLSSSSSHSTIPHSYQKGVQQVPSSGYIQSPVGPVLSSESTSQIPQGVSVSWSGTISSAPPQPSHFCMAPLLTGGQGTLPPSQQPVLFIAPNLESVPPGCIIVNPRSGQPYLNKDGTPMVYQPMTQLPQQSQPATHLPTPGVMGQQQQQQQQMVSQPCQHSNVYTPQSIPENQLSAPQMVHYPQPTPQQPVQQAPVQMAPISTGEYQEMQGQFVNLSLVPPEGEGTTHIQVPQVSTQHPMQHRTNPQPVTHGMMAIKGPAPTVIKGGPGHDMPQPYTTVQQTQQIPGHFAAHLPLDGHFQQTPSPQSSMQQLCQPSVQSQQIGIHRPPQGMTPIYYPSQQEGQPESQAKPQTVYAPGYPGAVPTGVQPQIIYISDTQPCVEQPIQTFVPNSQGGQLASSSRDVIRPASPHAQTIPGGYSLQQQQQVVGQQNYPIMQGGHGPPPQGVSRTNLPSYQVVPTPIHGTGGLVHPSQPAALVQHPSQIAENPATRKELWRVPYQPVPQYQHHITVEGNEEVLEVSQLPRDLSCQAVLPLLKDIAQFGAKIYWIPKTAPQATSQTPSQVPSQVPGTKLVSDFTILAIFPNPELAQKAVFNSANAKYSLQQPVKNYFPISTGE